MNNGYNFFMRQVTLIFHANRSYDRQVIYGIAQHLRTHTDNEPWQLRLIPDPAYNLPDPASWLGDGIIARLDNPEIRERVTACGLPVVGIGGASSRDLIPATCGYVAIDNQAISAMAADHLLELGYRSFAYVGLAAPSAHQCWSADRAHYFTAHLAQHHLTCALAPPMAELAWHDQQQVLGQWLTTLPKPLAVFACNDRRARFVSDTCLAVGLSIPEQVAIIGVDNDGLSCELTNPSLSSVLLDTDTIGAASAQMLNDMMNHPADNTAPWQTVAPITIVRRSSTDIAANTTYPLIGTAIKYMSDDQLATASANAIAKRLQVSRSRLDQEFKQGLGRTTHDEIRRRRLLLAQHLLTTTDLPIKAIARQAGYTSPQYMTTVMRQSTKQTPQQYRSNATRLFSKSFAAVR
ncbi:MAG: XylR family transcriptional regulator [Planctomycetota bacterium]|jgi:LacI family transcriptional regulator